MEVKIISKIIENISMLSNAIIEYKNHRQNGNLAQVFSIIIRYYYSRIVNLKFK